MSNIELIEQFYSPQTLTNSELISEFLHDELELSWHSTKGFLKFDKQKLIDYSFNLGITYNSSRFVISHLLESNNTVTVRYIHYANQIDDPEQELILAYFVAIWEIKDQKLHKGFLMSQL